MEMTEFVIFLTAVVLLFISVALNIILFLYSRKVLLRVYTASEEASEIFTMLDAYQEHLKSVYELPTFYGDDTLSGLLGHTRDLFAYLEKYEEVYSFTNPDLLEQLELASRELQEKYETETPQEEE